MVFHYSGADRELRKSFPRNKQHETKPQQRIPLATGGRVDRHSTLHSRLGWLGHSRSSPSSSARVAGVDLCRDPHAHSAQQSLGVRHRYYRAGSMELHESVPNPPHADRDRAALVSSPYRPCQPARSHHGGRRRPRAFHSHTCLPRRLSAIEARPPSVVAVHCGRSAGDGLPRSYRPSDNWPRRLAIERSVQASAL
jgi:hypothetical protein